MSSTENTPASLPYAGTSGHSGTDTSEDRATRADGNGTTSDRQHTVLSLASGCGVNGVTVAELRTTTGWHHGTASGALSVLHMDGSLARLTVSRRGCKVYVLARNVDGRDTEAHGRKSTIPVPKPAMDALVECHGEWRQGLLHSADLTDVLTQFLADLNLPSK